MTLQLIFMAVLYLLMMICTFVIGYTFAMRHVLQHLQDKILPKTGEMLDTYAAQMKNPDTNTSLNAMIDGRMQVVDELGEALRPPFSKKK